MDEDLTKVGLDGNDYATLPIQELVMKTDYSNKAAYVVNRVLSMSTQELDALADVIGEK